MDHASSDFVQAHFTTPNLHIHGSLPSMSVSSSGLTILTLIALAERGMRAKAASGSAFDQSMPSRRLPAERLFLGASDHEPDTGRNLSSGKVTGLTLVWRGGLVRCAKGPDSRSRESCFGQPEYGGVTLTSCAARFLRCHRNMPNNAAARMIKPGIVTPAVIAVVWSDE
jgi:hypothetical protein